MWRGCHGDRCVWCRKKKKNVMKRRDAFTHCGRWCSAAACLCTLNHACRSHASWGKDKGTQVRVQREAKERGAKNETPPRFTYTKNRLYDPSPNVGTCLLFLLHWKRHPAIAWSIPDICVFIWTEVLQLPYRAKNVQVSTDCHYSLLFQSIKSIEKEILQTKRSHKQLLELGKHFSNYFYLM